MRLETNINTVKKHYQSHGQIIKKQPMEHDSYNSPANEVKISIMSSPKSATLNFIRQFARTCVTVQGCALGSMIIN